MAVRGKQNTGDDPLMSSSGDWNNSSGLGLEIRNALLQGDGHDEPSLSMNNECGVPPPRSTPSPSSPEDPEHVPFPTKTATMSAAAKTRKFRKSNSLPDPHTAALIRRGGVPDAGDLLRQSSAALQHSHPPPHQNQLDRGSEGAPSGRRSPTAARERISYPPTEFRSKPHPTASTYRPRGVSLGTYLESHPEEMDDEDDEENEGESAPDSSAGRPRRSRLVQKEKDGDGGSSSATRCYVHDADFHRRTLSLSSSYSRRISRGETTASTASLGGSVNGGGGPARSPPRRKKSCMSVKSLEESLHSVGQSGRGSSRGDSSHRGSSSGRRTASTSLTADDVDEDEDVSRRSNRSVGFDSLHIREYPITVGDNPSVTFGPAISIGWEYDSELQVDVDEWELNRPRRRRDKEMVVPRATREDWLMEIGHTRREMANSIRQQEKDKRSRRRTLNNMGKVQLMEDAAESAARKLKRLLFLKKKDTVLYDKWKAEQSRARAAKYIQEENEAAAKEQQHQHQVIDELDESKGGTKKFPMLRRRPTNRAPITIQEDPSLSQHKRKKKPAPRATAA